MGGWCPDVLFENLEMARTDADLCGRVVDVEPFHIGARRQECIDAQVAEAEESRFLSKTGRNRGSASRMPGLSKTSEAL